MNGGLNKAYLGGIPTGYVCPSGDIIGDVRNGVGDVGAAVGALAAVAAASVGARAAPVADNGTPPHEFTDRSSLKGPKLPPFLSFLFKNPRFMLEMLMRCSKNTGTAAHGDSQMRTQTGGSLGPESRLNWDLFSII